MYDVKTIAFNAGVTVQTIYNHIKKNDKELIGHIFKKQGTSYLDDEGIRLIKISMGLIQVPTVQKDIGIEEVIENISIQVSDKVKDDIVNELKEDNKKQRQSYELKFYRLEQELNKEIEELKNQNQVLIEIIQQLLFKNNSDN